MEAPRSPLIPYVRFTTCARFAPIADFERSLHELVSLSLVTRNNDHGSGDRESLDSPKYFYFHAATHETDRNAFFFLTSDPLLLDSRPASTDRFRQAEGRLDRRIDFSSWSFPSIFNVNCSLRRL